jgi:hypothetical protein
MPNKPIDESLVHVPKFLLHAMLRMMVYSMKDINWVYAYLTEEEKENVSPEEFNKIKALVEQQLPDAILDTRD